MLEVDTSEGAKTTDSAAAPVPPPRRPRWTRRIRVQALWALVRGAELTTRMVPPLGSPALGELIGRWIVGSIPGLRRNPLRQIQQKYREIGLLR